MYDGLVLSGGGMKGFLQLGFLDNLYAKNKVNFKYYSGCSIGAILCVLLSVGYTPQELISYFCMNDVCALFKDYNPLLLTDYYGLMNNSIILNYIEHMVNDKLGYIPTFRDLYEKHGKIFVCPAYKLNYHDEPYTYFTHYTHPNMYITKAAVLSSNIPFIFTKAEYNGCYYIDGAVFDNFPIGKLLEVLDTDPWNENLDYNIIALKMESTNRDIEIESLSTYIKLIFTAATKNKSHSLNNKVEVVNIKSDISSIDFNISSKDKINLFINGANQCKEYLKGK